ncbi:MAG: DUF4097 family beta strand repeat protein [Planctomycetota bacterium]|nr:MAG: DUF4097 family beta strand repeat protein [Planctomycetota bacterium]
MKTASLKRASLGWSLCLLVLVASCGINIGSCFKAKHKRTDQLSAPIEPGSTLVAETSFGSITVRGANVATCDVTAEITVQAPTEKEAQEIAENVKITLESIGKTLTLDVEKPKLKNNRSVGVSFDITVPEQTNLECATSFGKIKLNDIDGNVKARTGFAAIDTDDIQGSVQLETSYGRVTCRRITPTELLARSSFGAIDIVCSPQTKPEINADIETSFGEIDFVAPPNFSGRVELETSFGSIDTDLPLTIKGSLSEDKIKGTIGDGSGSLRLKTSFGSINLK